MLDHETIRNELIRQLEAGEIKGVEVSSALKIPEPRVTEMRKRIRRVQPQEMKPLAHLLGLMPDQAETMTITVVLPNVRDLTEMFEGLFESLNRPDLADELALRLAQRLPSALRRTLDHSQGRDAGKPARLAAIEERLSKDRLVRR